MKIVVNIQDSLIDQVREAVEAGAYADPREFLITALENQAKLELGDDTLGITTLGQAIKTEAEQSQTDTNPVNRTYSSSGTQNTNTLNQLEYYHVRTVTSPESNRLDQGPLWGQYNRIFPVKLLLRVLANILQYQSSHVNSQGHDLVNEWVSLDQFSQQASDIARNYGLKIKQADKQQSRGRGMRLSAALPIGDDPEKSKERFRIHFVGGTDQQGHLSGAAPHLLFVNIPPESPNHIGITDPGLSFAKMWNPLIDGGASSDQSLSEDEATFYIQHVGDQHPDEYNAMQLVATAIVDGDNRPESLTNRVAVLNEGWSEAQASTVRSGIVGRMYELGLVQRERVGQRGIAYQLTKEGHEFQTSHNQ
jgi:hypothetical protein